MKRAKKIDDKLKCLKPFNAPQSSFYYVDDRRQLQTLRGDSSFWNRSRFHEEPPNLYGLLDAA